MMLEGIKNFSTGILWDSTMDPMYKWVDKIQGYRNAIHSFNFRDIGTAGEFLEDIDVYCNFVDLILDRIPPLEEIITWYQCD
ncbi:MAG: hypothetical protein K6G87_06420 [Butyrivibrio sp.]|uniref:hypothetical protein n=1 Tax=Butyrivibrio sp. TaxID=28121 RepID=UPI0025FB0165|nr:hypothetical protein [Butyrivibrio sp.]MCR5770853.1 hypothetical protein [Butyrivibrio sp.]